MNNKLKKLTIITVMMFFLFITLNSNIFAEVEANVNQTKEIDNIFDIDISTETYKFSEKELPNGPFFRYTSDRVLIDRELSGIGVTFSDKTIDVTAPVTGIQTLFATDTIRINSDMEYAVVFSNQNVIIDGNITRDLIVFSENKLTIGENAKISGDVICYGSEVEVKGTIEGSLIGAAPVLKVSGNIGKNLRMQLNNIELVDGNKIDGNIFVITYNKDIDIKSNYPNAKIKVYEKKTNTLNLDMVLSGLITSLVFTALYLVIDKASKGNLFAKMIKRTKDNTLFFVISGALSLMIIVPVVFVLSILSIFGLSSIAIPALIIYLSFLLVVGLLSTFIIGSFLIKYMYDTRFKDMGMGTKILSSLVIFMLLFILARIPIVGGYITIILVMFALGIVTTCIFKRENNSEVITK